MNQTNIVVVNQILTNLSGWDFFIKKQMEQKKKQQNKSIVYLN